MTDDTGKDGMGNDNGSNPAGGRDESGDESNSMFDQFLVFGSFSALISLDGLFLLAVDWLFGLSQQFLLLALGGVLFFILMSAWSRMFRWIDKVASEADPDRTALIRTPAILQKGYERLQGNLAGVVLLVGIAVGYPLLFMFWIREFINLFDQPLWGFFFIGPVYAIPVMVGQSAIAIIASLTAGKYDTGEEI